MKLLKITMVWATLATPNLLAAQTTPTKPCTEKVYLHDGSILVGKIQSYESGNQLLIKTSAGWEMTVPTSGVKKIVQKCAEGKTARQPKIYSFRERGFFQHTRVAALPGLDWAGNRLLGFAVQHVSGFQFSRKIGAGIGIGSDVFSPGGLDAVTYPIFAEARTYLFAKNTTPFFSAGAGWSFVGKNSIADEELFNRIPTDWDGGWMAQLRAGYRIGNHFTIEMGARWQRKNMNWRSRWNAGETGTDKILNQRLELGFGIIF